MGNAELLIWSLKYNQIRRKIYDNIEGKDLVRSLNYIPFEQAE